MHRIPPHLFYSLIAFAESDNLIEASSKLGITQPALSKQLILLEQLLPYKVFSQQGRRKILSNYGQELYIAVKGNVSGIHNSITEVNNRFSQPSMAIVKIAARREVIDRLAPSLKFPGSIIYLDGHSSMITNHLLKKSIDIGISQFVPESSHLVAKVVSPLEFKIFVHKTIHKRKIEWSKKDLLNLLEIPFLSYQADSPLLAQILNHFGINALPRSYRVNSNWECIATMLRAHLGWAIAPANISIDRDQYWVIDIPHKIIAPVDLFMIYQKELSKIFWFNELLISLNNLLKM